MTPTTLEFKANTRVALGDAQLQRALAGLPGGLVAQRAAAKAKLPEWEALRDAGKALRDHTLQHLDLYLETYEKNAKAAGAHVHWASTSKDARDIILKICADAKAKVVTKGKSMISEEIALNAHLQSAGMEVVETDLGEYLVQIRNEHPSHIIAPAIHLTQAQVEADFRKTHTHLPKDRVLEEPETLVGEARAILRQKFLDADVGITGANFLIAETGSSIIVTNEGNGDLTQSLAKVHVVIASIDKVIPTLEDVSSLLRLLARSATGQEFSNYTTFSTGPRRKDDPDGPEQYHVVLLDNGRSEILGSELKEVLRCIRCAACMNHCPVYNAVGGHAYGWVYPGPIGSVMTPALIGVGKAAHLPNASTFCGKCAEVCPMKIPLPDLMRVHRTTDFAQGGGTWSARTGLAMWAWLAKRPRLYHLTMRFVVADLHALSRWTVLKYLFGFGAMGWSRGRFSWLPFVSGWTKHRDLAAPQGRTFQQLWAETQRGVPR